MDFQDWDWNLAGRDFLQYFGSASI